MKLERATAADLPDVAALMNAAFRGTGSDAGSSQKLFLSVR